MTTEEKARAYDEALKKAQCWLNSPQTIKDCCYTVEDAIQNIFPQLRKSEDEKVKRWIIEKVKGYADSGIPCSAEIEMANKALSYLEKQKEPHYTKRNALFDKCVENCDPEVMKEVSDKVDEMLEKEQKPVEYLPKEKVYDIMNKLTELSTSDLIPLESDEYVKIHEITSDVCNLLNYPIEQKPAEYGDDVVEEAEEYTNKVNCGEYGVAVTEAYIAGILSERNRKPAEWSEEDGKNIENIRIHLLHLGEDAWADTITKLKSLRP